VIKIDAKVFLKALRRAQENFAKTVYDAVRRAAQLTAEHARNSTGDAAFKDGTGELRRSIQPVYLSDTKARAETKVRHAAWVERGNGFRRPGQEYIYPTNGPFLVFKVDGHKVVTRKVKHSRPRPYMAEAQKIVEPKFLEMCREAVAHMFR
jgi:hypothetical protein